MPSISPMPPVAPNGAPYGWPLMLRRSHALPAGASTPLTLSPRSACWLLSLGWRIFDRAAPATPQITAILSQITVRGEFILQDQGAVGPFEAPIDATPRPYSIFRLARPILLNPNDALTYTVAVAAGGAALQIDAWAETYRYVAAEPGRASLGPPA